MYILDFYFLEDPPENHLWVIGGLLENISLLLLLLFIILNIDSFWCSFSSFMFLFSWKHLKFAISSMRAFKK